MPFADEQVVATPEQAVAAAETLGFPVVVKELRESMGRGVHLDQVLTGDEVMQLQEIVRKVPVADHVIRYALQFSRLTRRTPSATGL